MLKSFEVENYRNFKNKLVFDLSVDQYLFNTGLVIDGVANKMLIYGKNGIGKSNLGKAIFDIVVHLTDNFIINYIGGIKPYLNLNNQTKPAVFKYSFKFKKDIVTYEYAKNNPLDLVYEKLYFNNDLVVDINYNDISNYYISDDLKGNLNINLKDNKLSIIKYIYKNTPTDDNRLLTQMMEFVNNMLWYRSLSNGNEFIGFTNNIYTFEDAIAKSHKVKDLEKFLKQNGVNLNLTIEEINGANILYANYDNGKAPFRNIASTGSMALYLYYVWNIIAFNKISFLFIDEFDAFLHYESAEMLVKLLNKMSSFQNVLTSHNTYVMNNELTRPDCCYIMTENKITNLKKCTDKEIREAHNLEKMYRNGAFIYA